jgi:hypothetical protein
VNGTHTHSVSHTRTGLGSVTPTTPTETLVGEPSMGQLVLFYVVFVGVVLGLAVALWGDHS